jgi:starch phosphorylase
MLEQMRGYKQRPMLADTSEVKELRSSILAKLKYSLGKDRAGAGDHDWFLATALAARDHIVDRWTACSARTEATRRKQVYYLSIEYLIGRLLFDALINLDLLEDARQALNSLGINLEHLRTLEPDAALGSGGLGRLAACFMDSAASLGVPTYGYGIRYQLGLFKQFISEGWQHELPDDWLALRNPWEFERPDVVYPVRFGGTVEYVGSTDDTARGLWYPAEIVLALAYDTPIAGWRGRHVNTLRLWSARAADPIQLELLHRADLGAAMASRAQAEAICQSLYPSEATPEGREGRLRQEFFFTSASLQDIVRRHLLEHTSLDNLPAQAAIQLNDTHPALAVAELMRILVDEHEYSWAKAWNITRATLNYTNHTLLPEALESWPVALLNRLLPRHMQIIFLINHNLLGRVAASGNRDLSFIASVSLIDESPEKRVRMGHLAFAGSNKVNGVSALHTDLMRQTTFRGLATALPGRIVNKTNGISFRRWLFQANPALTALLTQTLGEHILDDTDAIGQAERHVDDPAFVRRFGAVRLQNKNLLSGCVHDLTGHRLDPSALFDVQIKRIHEYKRQLLNILETIALYRAMRAQPEADWTPRVKILAGKAAADYERAKLIIKLAHDVGRVINADAATAGRLKLVFLPNYSVSLAEAIVPAADLSEQISTAGMEASGTGNMKLALNGALTIGTLDGANVEICERVGADNIFIFGMKAEQVADRRRIRFSGREAVEHSPVLKEVFESLAAGDFSPDDRSRYRPLLDDLLEYDHFMVTADFDAYWDTQRLVDSAWKDQARWMRASILNMARTGWFSSDRTIRDYARDIWHVPA